MWILYFPCQEECMKTCFVQDETLKKHQLQELCKETSINNRLTITETSRTDRGKCHFDARRWDRLGSGRDGVFASIRRHPRPEAHTHLG